jgi:hypothetical protein
MEIRRLCKQLANGNAAILHFLALCVICLLETLTSAMVDMQRAQHYCRPGCRTFKFYATLSKAQQYIFFERISLIFLLFF